MSRYRFPLSSRAPGYDQIERFASVPVRRSSSTVTHSGLRSAATRPQLARAAIEEVVCNLLAGADHLPAGHGDVLLIGGGARSIAYRQVVADLTGRRVVVPDDTELVARGAAVQAAAVLTGRSFEAITSDWGDRSSVVVEPNVSVDAAGIRAAYDAAVEPLQPREVLGPERIRSP